MKRVIVSLSILLIPVAISAHHSRAEYDTSVVTEFEGTVERILWMNPHVRLLLNVSNDDGTVELWELEGTAPTVLSHAGIEKDVLEVGATVRVAGDVSTRRDNHMFVTNLLLPDATEIPMTGSGSLRWTERDSGGDTDAPELVAENTESIFHVWLSTGGDRPDFINDPPFTDAGRIGYESYDPVTDDPVLDCTPPGMPRFMTRSGRRPFEFVDDGNRILLRSEEFSLVREIHLTATEPPEDQPNEPLGYSVGRWEDDHTLVVRTTRIDWPYFQLYGFEGAPQSTETEITERFSLSEDGQELIYDITADDSLTFTEPVVATEYRIFRREPGLELITFEDCAAGFSE